ncbi:hypothetical protein [Sulfuracidifex metallicus]|uniref:hypothetical protein n=1 Tax=Sulfuracidifex metallicus TaxID=47303 RepID=UPI000AF29274|nr:hypothetical protein [Sulfuracidifex metallicus]
MKYSIPYIAYITVFAVIPFISTFVIAGVNYNLKPIDLIPLEEVLYNTSFFCIYCNIFNNNRVLPGNSSGYVD